MRLSVPPASSLSTLRTAKRPAALRMRSSAQRMAKSSAMLAAVFSAVLATLAPPFVPGVAEAHPLAPALLEVREQAHDRVEVLWRTTTLRPITATADPILPAGCRTLDGPVTDSDRRSITSRWLLDCGDGLIGKTFGASGLAESGINVLVRVELADGRKLQQLFGAEGASFTITRRTPALAIAGDYLRLGIDHILGGIDHLLFIACLLLLASSWRRLLATVTAFTAGHTVTLSLAVLGFVRFPAMLIEVAIALSIAVLAAELARGDTGRPSLLRRRPWAAAVAFGLLHGFGFAGALTEIGLPAGDIPLALAAFNGGIEIGQLLFVAALLFLGYLLRPLTAWAPPRLATLPAYAAGSLAAFWTIERASVLF